MLQFMHVRMTKISVQDSLKWHESIVFLKNYNQSLHHASKYHSCPHCLHIVGKSHRQTLKIFKLFAQISRYEKKNQYFHSDAHGSQSTAAKQKQEQSEMYLSLERNL